MDSFLLPGSAETHPFFGIALTVPKNVCMGFMNDSTRARHIFCRFEPGKTKVFRSNKQLPFDATIGETDVT